MVKLNWAATIAAVLAASLTTSASAQMALGQFTTADGHEIVLPPIETMSCAEKSAVLSQIDRTGYRAGGFPRHAADEPLFDYEDALASTMMTCGGPDIVPSNAPFRIFTNGSAID